MNICNNSLITKTHVIAGFGNPLLDISASVQTNTILEVYNLKCDGQKEVNDIEIYNILELLQRKKYDTVENPGGCAQNTLRIIQSLVRQPGFCVYFGGLGGDINGEFIESEVKKIGVETRYAKHDSLPTGKVIALINGENRSLVANLGAAEVFTLEDFKTDENMKLLEEVILVYIEGFFITHSLDVAIEVITSCKTNGVVVVFNISGAYVADIFPNELRTAITLADIVIGNSAEFKALAKVIGLECDGMKNLALATYSYLYKNIGPLPNYKLRQMNELFKVVIITQGKEPVLCVYGNKVYTECPVPRLDHKLIKDPTGAGDSFTAGFLVALIEGKLINDCLAFGCFIAQKVIQCIGVNLPSNENHF